MSKTKTIVKQHVAEILGLKTVGQAITQPWEAKLDELWDSAYAKVKRDNINVFSSSGPVPDEIFHEFSMIMADMGKTTFSVPEERYLRITREYPQAWSDIRKYSVDRYESIDGPKDY